MRYESGYCIYAVFEREYQTLVRIPLNFISNSSPPWSCLFPKASQASILRVDASPALAHLRIQTNKILIQKIKLNIAMSLVASKRCIITHLELGKPDKTRRKRMTILCGGPWTGYLGCVRYPEESRQCMHLSIWEGINLSCIEAMRWNHEWINLDKPAWFSL